jgi:hypothetical protein
VIARRHRWAQEEGQTIIIVVLFMIVLLGFCALTLDVGHAYLAQRRLQSSVDAAALAGATELPSIGNANTRAKEYGDGGKNSPNGVDGITMDVSTKCLTSVPGGCAAGNANAVTVKETGVVNTVFGKLLGRPSFTVHASATACSPCGAKPLDIMMVLDRTGSMCQAPDGTNGDCSDLEAAQSAMMTFLRFMDPTLDHVGLAVLPPAPSATSTCPSIGIASPSAYRTPTDPYVIVPLSSDYSVGGVLDTSSPLVSKINCVVGAGSTSYANALEMAEAQLVKDGRSNVQKVIVFMSDGAANTGPTSYSDSSPYRATPCTQGVASAAAIKGAGTIIYSIGFGVDAKAKNICKNSRGGDEIVGGVKVDAKDALTDIASPGNYFNAPTPQTLGGIWAAVAADLLAGTSRLVDDNAS